MATLLVVHHTTSPHLQAMFEAVMSGATNEAIEGVTVVARPALVAAAIDVLKADGYLLGTPANIGYMSGALKHFFDQVYYPCWMRPCDDRMVCMSTATATPPGRSGRSRRLLRVCSGGARRRRWPSLAPRAGRTSGPAGNLAPRSRPA